MKSRRWLGRWSACFTITWVHHSEDIPPAYFHHEESPEHAAVDYLAGMTDHYAIRLAEGLQPGISQGLFARVPLV